MRQQVDGADVGIHIGHARKRRLRGRVDARQPQIGCYKELVSTRGGRVLRVDCVQSGRNPTRLAKIARTSLLVCRMMASPLE